MINQNKKDDSRTETTTIRLSKKSKDELKKYGEKTKLGECTLGTLAIMLLLDELKIMEDNFKEIGKNLEDFCQIYEKSYANFAFVNIKSALNNAPQQDKIMFEICVERNKNKKNNFAKGDKI